MQRTWHSIHLITWSHFNSSRQIVVSCRKGKTDESLSFLCLLLWFFSDSIDFLGLVLTGQIIVLVSDDYVACVTHTMLYIVHLFSPETLITSPPISKF